jgi:hypothetical protein
MARDRRVNNEPRLYCAFGTVRTDFVASRRILTRYAALLGRDDICCEEPAEWWLSLSQFYNASHRQPI